MSQKHSRKVVVSFVLHYQEMNKKWHQVSAESDMYDSNFTEEALEEIRSKGTVAYEVE